MTTKGMSLLARDSKGNWEISLVSALCNVELQKDQIFRDHPNIMSA